MRFIGEAIVIGFLFVALTYILSYAIPSLLNGYAIGLWPILFCDIVIECQRSPDLGRG
jgi:hypothetical protein